MQHAVIDENMEATKVSVYALIYKVMCRGSQGIEKESKVFLV